MGLEQLTRVTLNGEMAEGMAHCGDGEISFRGAIRFRWLWKDLVAINSTDGILSLVRGSDRAELHLGEESDKWAFAIKNPKSRLDKLGIKPGHRYIARGEFDNTFPDELLARAGEPSSPPFDAVILRLDPGDEFEPILKARSQIAPNGMIWVIWPKGNKALREGDIRAFALGHGLVDVKVASFSNELSALKLVIPVALR